MTADKTSTEPERTKPEFSRPFNAERLNDAARAEQIVANKAECAALAKRLEIPDVLALSAELTLERVPDEPRLVEVRGTLSARVVQSCVVTLEPVTQDVVAPFDTLFASEGYVQRWLRDNPHDEYDAPEALDGTWLDMGELVTQFLILELDPYPRCEGVELPGMISLDEPAEEKQTPFAVLKKLTGEG